MKKSQLWKIYVAKNPSFAGEGNVTLSARGLRKMFDQTWDLAFHEGEEENEPPPQPVRRPRQGGRDGDAVALRPVP